MGVGVGGGGWEAVRMSVEGGAASVSGWTGRKAVSCFWFAALGASLLLSVSLGG